MYFLFRKIEIIDFMNNKLYFKYIQRYLIYLVYNTETILVHQESMNLNCLGMQPFLIILELEIYIMVSQ